MREEWYKDIYYYLTTLIVNRGTLRERRALKRRCLRFCIKEETLLRIDIDGLKVCVRVKDIRKILKQYHNEVFGGYFGRDITVAKIRRIFFWPTLYKDTVKYVKTCDECQ